MYSQNVNGLSLQSKGDNLIEELTTLKDIGVSYANFIETRLNQGKDDTYDTAKRVI